MQPQSTGYVVIWLGRPSHPRLFEIPSQQRATDSSALRLRTKIELPTRLTMCLRVNSLSTRVTVSRDAQIIWPISSCVMPEVMRIPFGVIFQTSLYHLDINRYSFY